MPTYFSMNEEPKPGTWGAVTRSTEEEHQEFKRMLDRLMITPERLNNVLQDLIDKNKEKK